MSCKVSYHSGRTLSNNALYDLRKCVIKGGTGSSAVHQLIIRVSDQLKAGGIRLIDCTPEEATEAKDPLDSHRAKRRERHVRKKAWAA